MVKKIFLSYRREDRPGYVARLKDDLERAFGRGRVFRDVEDIAGGSKWKEVLEQNLRNAGVLLLIIGPRWSSIWEERAEDPVNYVAFELERARELEIPVVPVTLDGATLSKQIDLGEIAWLLDNQTYDISDKQGRWGTDVKGLIALIEHMPGMEKTGGDSVAPEPSKSPTRGRIVKMIGLAVAALAILGVLMEQDPDQDPVSPAVWEAKSPQEPRIVATTPPPQDGRQAAVAGGSGHPDIAGIWRSQADDTLYHVTQYDDGSFDIVSPGYAVGRGRFIDRMPRKFKVQLDGVGWGEYSVSNGDQKISGWFVENGSSQQLHDTLVRVQ